MLSAFPNTSKLMAMDTSDISEVGLEDLSKNDFRIASHNCFHLCQDVHKTIRRIELQSWGSTFRIPFFYIDLTLHLCP
jgi:hypothetical protein